MCIRDRERDGRAAPRRRNPIGVQFFKTQITSLLSPLSLSGGRRFLRLFVCWKVSLSYQNHHVNRALVVETCCEEINVKSFVKLQFCQEEVRKIERTRLGKRSGFLLLNSNVSFSLSLSVVFLCQFLCKTHHLLQYRNIIIIITNKWVILKLLAT